MYSQFIVFPNLTQGNCPLGVQLIYNVYGFRAYLQGTVGRNAACFMVSEPTSRRLLARDAALLYGIQTYLKGPIHLWLSCLSFWTYLQATVGQRCSLLIQFLNLSPGDCKPGCSQFIWFPNLPPEDCRCQGNKLFIWLWTYFQGTVRVECSLVLRFLNLPPGNCLPGLFIRFPNLPPGDCRQELKLVFIVPRLFEEKRRDIVFGIPSFRPSVLPSVRPSVLPSFRPPNIVGTLCAQLLLQFYADSFETLQMF